MIMSEPMPEYLTERDVSFSLIDIEERHRLWEYKINGYCVWQLFRFPLALAMQGLPFESNSRPFNRMQYISHLFSHAVSDFLGIAFPGKANFLVMTCSSALAEEENGKYKDIYFDDLLTNLDSCYKIETLNNRIFENRRDKALIKVNATEAIFNLLTSILYRCLKSSSEIKRIAAIFSNVISKEIHLENYSPEVTSHVISIFFWKKYLYSNFLKTLRPSCVLLIDTSRFEITAAAKEQGIKVVEFQHGIFTKYHPDALSISAEPFKQNLIIKNKYFLYGDYWKQQLEENGFYDKELCVVGNIRLDNYRAKRSKYLKNRNDELCKIVLTTQGLDNQRLSNFMSEFVKLADKKISYTLYIKLHPIQVKSRAQFEESFKLNKNVVVLLGNEEPNTFELLANADYHISIASACHYDAIGMGVPTIILPLAGHEVVLNLFKAGHAALVNSPEELLNFILNNRNYHMPSEVSAWYFKPNAIQNIKTELGLSEVIRKLDK